MSVTVCEVGPRDGLQNEAVSLAPEVRAELVDQLAATGLASIEAVSFVRPDRVPQMAGAEEVVEGIDRREGVTYSGLVLNERGYERLAAAALEAAHYTFAATEAFNRRNQNTSVAESAATAAGIVERARRDGIAVTVALSVSFGCPFEGAVDPGRVLELAEHAVGVGAHAVTFADTIGVAVPRQVRRVVRDAVELGVPVGVHLHNTRSTGYANAYAAIEAGATIVDAAVGGTGGCPFAPRATGNIATEDLAYLLAGEGIETGIDLDALIAVADWLEGVLGRTLPGQLHRAGAFAPVSG